MQREADDAGHQEEHDEYRGRHARHEREAEHHHRRDHEGARLSEQLAADVLADIGRQTVLGRDARDDHARADRDEQRRDLCDQAVADGQDRVLLERVARRHAALQHADQQAAEQVDRHDDQAGDRVALDELHRAVHRTVELALLLDDATAAARLVHVDHAGAHVAVDRHLLAGHGVQREARPDLGHPFGALGDHDELHDRQDHEHDQADDQVAADDEVAEGLHDVPGIRLEQDQARRRDRQADAEQRRHQQHGGERGERQRRRDVHRHHQQDGGEAHVDRDQRVHQRQRQRQDHHEDDCHDDER